MHRVFNVDATRWSLYQLECAEYDCGQAYSIELSLSELCVGSELDSLQPAHGNSVLHTTDWCEDEDRLSLDEGAYHSHTDYYYPVLNRDVAV